MSKTWTEQLAQKKRDQKRREKDRLRRERKRMSKALRVARAIRDWW